MIYTLSKSERDTWFIESDTGVITHQIGNGSDAVAVGYYPSDSRDLIAALSHALQQYEILQANKIEQQTYRVMRGF